MREEIALHRSEHQRELEGRRLQMQQLAEKEAHVKAPNQLLFISFHDFIGMSK